MRLLYLTDRLSDRGGADHHLAQVVGAMADAGHEVSVGYGRDDGGTLLPDGVGTRRFRGLAARVDSGARLTGLAAVLDDADVIHVQNVMNPNPLAMAVSRNRTVVTVQDHRVFCPGRGKTMPDRSVCRTPMADGVCRDCLPDDGYRRATLILTRRRLDALRLARTVVLSSFMAGELASVGVPGAEVLPPWVEPGEPRTESGSTFVIAGRLVAHKGVLGGWRSWLAAGRPMPLVVAGTGPLQARLHGAELRGWLDADSLRATLRQARALLFPSRWQEPFGILGLQALAEGTPVIVADSGGTAEWSDGGCIRVPAGDEAAMAGAISRLAADPELALRLGRVGQRRVAERFSREILEPRIHELYAEVADGTGDTVE